MEEKKTIFDYISEVFATFGIIIMIMTILNLLIGDAASEYSSLFAYGKKAFSLAALFQMFLLSVVICASRNAILLTDRWLHRVSMLTRIILFFVTITVTIVIFVILFQWFPTGDIKAWIGFLVSFAICDSLGVVISKIREKTENKKMDQALERYKNNK